MGRRAEAVPVSQQAVDLRRERTALNRDAYLPDYVQSVAALGYVLVEGARPGEAMGPLVEAFMLCQQLPEHAQGILGAVVDLLRRGYAEDPGCP